MPPSERSVKKMKTSKPQAENKTAMGLGLISMGIVLYLIDCLLSPMQTSTEPWTMSGLHSSGGIPSLGVIIFATGYTVFHGLKAALSQGGLATDVRKEIG